MRRVGHKGADLIFPGNSCASFDAAREAGVDMIEFDVLPERRDGSGRLVMAHDYADVARREPLTLTAGLAHLAGDSFAEIEFDVDLKLPGYELAVLAALRTYGLVERTLVSSQFRASLALLRAAEPTLRLGWSVPKLRRDPFRSRALTPAAGGAVRVAQLLLPGRASAAIRSGACDALMAHWRLVTPKLVRAVGAAGGELFVWTVDELPMIQTLRELGVHGVISNDPRLFAELV
jgi:glycerophosphoryl diester phosphodiesterase